MYKVIPGTDIVYLSGEDPSFYKRGIGQYPARLSGGFQSPTEINASGGSQPRKEEGASSGGSQPRKEEGASHHARRGKNAEAFLNLHRAILAILVVRYACKVKLTFIMSILLR